MIGASAKSGQGEPDLFFDRYREAWANISGERLLSFWHPHGTVTRAGTGEVATPRQLAAQIDATKLLLPDLRLLPTDHAVSGSNTIFIHWKLSATFQGRNLESSGVDVFVVDAGLAVTGISYSDPARLIRQIAPELRIPELFRLLMKNAAML